MAELVERADAVPEPLARDEDRAADVEAEGVVLERRPVPLAHQEADQALVGLVQLLLAAGEADPRAVDDREVVGHRVVEPDEAVVEDGDRVLGYHFGRDRHAGESSGAVCRHFRLVLPVLEARLLPGRRRKPEDFLRYYAERFPTVELNTTGYRLPREEQFERWAEQTPPGFRFAPKLNAAPRAADFGTFAERVGLLGDRLGPVRVVVARRPRRGPADARCSARSTRSSRSPSTSGTSRGTASKPPAGERRARERARGRRAVPLPAPARAALRRRRPRAPGPSGSGRCSTTGVRVYCYFKHEDEPTAPARMPWACAKRSAR